MTRASMITAAGLAIAVAVAVAVAGCKQSSSPAVGDHESAAAATPATPAAPAPAKAPQAKADPQAPPIKAYATTSPAQLGTLPEGVGLAVGSTVPDVQVKTHLGKPTGLADLVKGGPLLLIFYRGGW